MKKALFLTSVLFALPAALSAQQAPAPSGRITAAETPWQVNCVSADNDALSCQLAKELQLGQNRQVITRATLFLDETGIPYLRVLLPHDLSIPDGLKLLVDEKEILEIPYTTSRPEGIYARAPLDASAIAALKEGAVLGLAATRRDGKGLILQLDLSGFASGFEKL